MYRACLSQLNIWRLRAVNWFKEEKGANEIIAIVLILAVVIALAVVFRKQIVDMANSLWDSIGTDFKTYEETTPKPAGA